MKRLPKLSGIRLAAALTAALPAMAAAELDLREANVTGVSVTKAGSGHRFAVTLHHDDDGEAGYADWWQVETLDGERLGRRDLAHAHGTRPFTRSATVAVPAGARFVVVRGHDREHGYGGQAAVVALDSGAAERIRQGPEPRDFAGYAGGATADPGDGLAVRVLGSGGPVLSNGRASSGYVVYADGEPRLLVDAGGGTAARMGEAGVDAGRLDAYLLTHLHIDHSADLPAILKSAYFQGRGEAPVTIAGPTGSEPFPGSEAWVAGLFDGEQGVYSYMGGFARKVAGGALNLEPRAVPADPADATVRTVYTDGDLTVTAVAVKHGPMPALAYRVDRAGRSVTFSGDLNASTGHLAELAAGSDVLIHDAALNPDVPSDSIAAKLHAHPREIAEAASAAGVDTVVLSHFMPPAEKQLARVVDTVAEGFVGTVLMARDNRLIGLPE